jgi:arylformamidase
MAVDWRNLPEEGFAEIYNPRIASFDVDATLARYAQRSAEARDALSELAEASNDIRYGPGPLQTLDLYLPTSSKSCERPLILFIHGGYWRGLDKRDHTFAVPPLIKAGAVVANVNYDLCPQISLGEMVRQIVDAVRFCHKSARDWGARPGGIILIGHSAGAHLSIRVLNQSAAGESKPADLIGGVAAISGIYEPEIILNLDVNAEAQITPEDASQNNCLTLPPTGTARLAVWSGADEPEGWKDQSRELKVLVTASGLEAFLFEEENTDHFTVLERAFECDSKGWEAIKELCGF